MAIKKSDLYSSLGASCEELRGGMDASQYKDYVLFMLFIKFVSDKYGDRDDLTPPVVIPKGARFKDMAALKGRPDIGDRINKEVIAPLFEANARLAGSYFPDFNDSSKLGYGREMVERLSNLICIFENPALDFSQNSAESDDILGEAYEYLMQHFASKAGRRNSGFYTPSEVSRIIAQILCPLGAEVAKEATIYDPACGTGSLLTAVARAVGPEARVYGQETNANDATLARIGMLMHGVANAEIALGDVIAKPEFVTDGKLTAFDYVVSSPPLNVGRWNKGADFDEDPFGRFRYGNPPKASADFAFIQHMLASLKPAGKMAVVMSLGALYRGGREAEIRRNILEADLLEAVVGLPSSLLFGTSIPVCLMIYNQSKPRERAGNVLFINANRNFEKTRNGNVLREQDCARIIEAFHAYSETDQFSRVVGLDEIRSNAYNLNTSRYVDSSELSALFQQYCGKFEKIPIKALALEMNANGSRIGFEAKPNALYVPKQFGNRKATASLEDVNSHPSEYYQVVLVEKALAGYVAQFLNTTIGRCALSAIADSNLSRKIGVSELKECFIALPTFGIQQLSIESHQKLEVLRTSIDQIAQNISLNPTVSGEFQSQLDSMLQGANKISDADDIRRIIRQGESKTVEFKETYSLCLRKLTRESYVEQSALKTIVAFLNSDGGTLLVGVSDSRQIEGIDREMAEFYKASNDQFLLHFKNRLKDQVGADFYPFIDYVLLEVDARKVLRVNCAPSNKPCFLGGSDFYVRTNPATDKIEGPKLVEYVNTHFKR